MMNEVHAGFHYWCLFCTTNKCADVIHHLYIIIINIGG